MSVRRRFFKISYTLIRVILDIAKEYKLIQKKGYHYTQSKMKKRHEKRAQQLFSLATSMGGVMIKLCQFFSSRRDFFPEAYIAILSELQDNVPPVPFTIIQEIIQSEYKDSKDIFHNIDDIPLASASLGQVHKATLKDGSVVVLKILKPDIEKQIDTDCAILYFVFKVLSHFKTVRAKVDIFSLYNEFIKVTGDELNFKREMFVSDLFQKGLAHLDFVKIPKVYSEYSTDRIIVMEYLEGDKINKTDIWCKRNNNREIIAQRLIEIYMEQFIEMGIIHYDPHPGNILVTDNNNLILMDFGMSGIITREMRIGIIEGIKAFSERDCEKMYDILMAQGFLLKNTNKKALIKVMDYFFNDLLEQFSFERESIYTTDLNPIFDDLAEIVYSQPFNIPYQWAFLGKTIGILSGCIATVYPEFKIYPELKKYADKILIRNIDELANAIIQKIKMNIKIMPQLPQKFSSFVDNIERGKHKITVDYSEMNQKLDEFKSFILKTISFSGFLITGTLAYIFFVYNKTELALPFGVISFLSLIFAILYRKKTPKDTLKKMIQ